MPCEASYGTGRNGALTVKRLRARPSLRSREQSLEPAPALGTPSTVRRFSPAMDLTADRAIALRRLEFANRHVAEGQKRVDKQAALMGQLERDGHDTKQGKMLLDEMKITLALQIEDRDRILRELGRSTNLRGQTEFGGQP
jgi:hypothetical protein